MMQIKQANAPIREINAHAYTVNYQPYDEVYKKPSDDIISDPIAPKLIRVM